MRKSICNIVLAMSPLVALVFSTFPSATAQTVSKWSEPVLVNLGRSFSDSNPSISRDGLSLYFNSNRPGDASGIWVSHRAGRQSPWGPAVFLGPNINCVVGSPQAGCVAFLPSLSRDGHRMYFSKGVPNSDIWVSWRANTNDDFGWQPPVNLGPGVNSPAFDAAPHIFEDEDEDGTAETLFFTSNRPGGLGGNDIYVSKLGSDGSFGPAAPVLELNSPCTDARPNLTRDGLTIYFYSNRPIGAGPCGLNHLWSATRKTTRSKWSTPVNLGNPPNSLFTDAHPAVSFDGRTLFFDSNRSGVPRVWMTTRTSFEEEDQ